MFTHRSGTLVISTVTKRLYRNIRINYKDEDLVICLEERGRIIMNSELI